MGEQLKKPESFQIDRRSWYRGNGSCRSRLLTFEGKRCCIGFYASACGVSDDRMKDVATPLSLMCATQIALPGMLDTEKHTSIVASRLLGENDFSGHFDTKREARIKELFASIGVTVHFVN